MDRTFRYNYTPTRKRDYAFSWRLIDFINRVKNGTVTEKSYKRLLHYINVHCGQAEIKIVITEHEYSAMSENLSNGKLYQSTMYMNLTQRYLSPELMEYIESSQSFCNINPCGHGFVDIEITTPIKKADYVVTTIKLLETNRQKGQ